MNWQFYWSAWWRLWPHWSRSEHEYGDLFTYKDNVFTFGPLQCRWYSK